MRNKKVKFLGIATIVLLFSLLLTSSFSAENITGTNPLDVSSERINLGKVSQMNAYSRTVSTSEFANPVNIAGADPHVMLHSDGYYYFTRTLGHRLDVWKSRTLTGIDLGERKTVWTTPPHLRDIWAPEIHFINGKWYIYYTANTGCGDACRGIYVLENSSADPLEGEWVDKGKVNTEYSGLDGTVFEHNGQMYFAYAAYGNWSGQHGSAIAIAQMSNPWTLSGENNILTYPEYEWEKKGMHVNEGAVILKRDDKIFLIFSGSACWEDDYAIGMLTTSVNSNLLDPASWSKSPEPLFSKSIENGVYGPGHNSFVQTKDGTEEWIVYHGNSAPGQGCGARPTRMQKITWNDDGTPNFGVPTNGPLEVPSAEYKIEAEHGTLHKVKLNSRKGASNQTVTLNNVNSSLLIEDINVPEAGTYTMTVTYSNYAGADATNYVSVNGKSQSILTYPTTGKNNFSTVTMEVDLKKGYNNTIQFMKDKHLVEIDYIEISGEVSFSIEADATYKLVNPNGNKALHVDDRNNVLAWDDSNGGASQTWQMVELADGSYKVIHPANGKVLSLDGNPAEAWVNVNVQDWNGTDIQKWRLAHVGNGYYKLLNVASGKALDVGGASIENENVGTWEDLPGGIAQMWLFYKLD
ncbi:family 43 glycosylhydrolase [Lederbergia wuyishanensis]|uniref:GH43 family beta-xylosidase n=1 Tax=Lederbergia wuyishanensis TaxID=1347903 RepID=A0ABU0D5T9_9BACI|nr:family 43 glycosylhydrolase [Lederbergia wuyishanensis]MDQ0343755.1 GH43 family beta-xylosidase [Lederbergia wuyishanensis]